MNNLTEIKQEYLNSILYNMNCKLSFKYTGNMDNIDEDTIILFPHFDNEHNEMYMRSGNEVIITDRFPVNLTIDYNTNKRLFDFNYYLRLNYIVLNADLDESDNVETASHDFLMHSHNRRTWIDFNQELGVDYPIYLLKDYEIIIKDRSIAG